MKQEHRITYETMLLKRMLYRYLADIITQAEDMVLRLTEEMAESEWITEQLEANDQMAWVGAMIIRDRAEETLYHELIYR